MQQLLLFLLFVMAAPTTSLAQAAATSPPEVISTHDNLTPAGRLEDGVLTVSLWAGVGDWYPEGKSARARRVEALGHEGGPLSIPSPLIRAPAGTTVQASIRNTLGTPLRLHGLCNRPGTCQPHTIPAGTTDRVQFVLGAEGTFHYWAETTGNPLRLRQGRDSQLGGVIVADPSGAEVRDRVFVMGLHEESGESPVELTVINGRSWPHTERLQHRVGETVRWRVVNLTAAPHAMHLHGFYFNVESVGDGVRDTQYSTADRRTAVTEQMPPGGVMSLAWVPERPGNWLFHCHMLVHMMPDPHGAAGHHVSDAAAAGMAGLVLGVHVTGDGLAVTTPDMPRRNLQLVVEAADRHDTIPSYTVNLVDPAGPAPRLSDRGVPGPVMVLTRGEPVAVEIVNHLTAPTAIHWHGIELESYDDGVPDFGGHAGSITPAVAPGGTFTARFTPSRAGTFIYHTHWHDPGQLAAGIYGPLIVLEPGETYEPALDHIIVFGFDGPYVEAPGEPLVVNGEKRPRPLELQAGMAHRLRFINITPNNVALTVQLLSGFDPIQWTLAGKDGAVTPSAQRTARPARQLVSVGETYDFEVAPLPPRPAGMWMELRRGNGELLFQWPVRVR
jgi:manganese oxidase